MNQLRTKKYLGLISRLSPRRRNDGFGLSGPGLFPVDILGVMDFFNNRTYALFFLPVFAPREVFFFALD